MDDRTGEERSQRVLVKNKSPSTRTSNVEAKGTVRALGRAGVGDGSGYTQPAPLVVVDNLKSEGGV